ncbi:MAG: T9SS type A sorting domain-containing protein [Flavobacteriales bacterium]|nr:T9SS type A sorting domain-containing protein [Flavobacteriales bacterium]
MPIRPTRSSLLAFALALSPFIANAQLPTLDPAFGSNGVLQVPLAPGLQNAGPGWSGDLVSLSSGAYLALGTAHYWDGFGITAEGVAQKFDACGNPDPSFGVNGLKQYNGGGSWRVMPTHGAELANGSLLLVGTTSTGWGAVSQNRHTTMRVLADGTLDDTYGDAGFIRHDAPDGVSSTYGRDMITLPNGRFLAAAVRSSNANGGSSGLALYGYLPNGEPDLGFGTGGSVQVPKPEFAYMIRTHLVGDTMILVAYGRRFVNTVRMEISAFDLDGDVLTTFGSSGAVLDTTDFFGDNGTINDFQSAVDGEGRLTILGVNAEAEIQLIRFLPNGTRDVSYGANGRVLVQHLGTNIMPTAGQLKVLANGDLLALAHAGTPGNSPTTQWARLTSEGQVLANAIDPWLSYGFQQASAVVELEAGRWLVNAASVFPSGLSIRRFSADAVVLPSISSSGSSLVSTGTGPDFQWYLDGNMINGATSSTFVPASNGSYTVQMTDALGCSVLSEPFQLLNVGVQALDPAAAIVVAGPDAYGMLTVRGEGTITYELLDARGQRLKTGNMASGFGQITMNELASGTYLLVLHAANGRQVFRFFAE